jgi:hypothetical protein
VPSEEAVIPIVNSGGIYRIPSPWNFVWSDVFYRKHRRVSVFVEPQSWQLQGFVASPRGVGPGNLVDEEGNGLMVSGNAHRLEPLEGIYMLSVFD